MQGEVVGLGDDGTRQHRLELRAGLDSLRSHPEPKFGASILESA